MTRLRKGESLERILSTAERVELADHPHALIALHSAWSMLGGDHFRPCTFSLALSSDDRLSNEDLNRHRDEAVEFLASSAWGTLVLNSSQAYFWANDLPLRGGGPNRKAFIAILSATTRHWDDFEALGGRFYAGGASGSRFDETLPLSGHILAVCGIDPRRAGRIAWPDIGPACLKANLVAKLATDDRFWQNVARGGLAVGGKPMERPLAEADEVQRRCREGGWNPADWDRLRELAGAQAVEAALAGLEERADWNALLGVYVHALGDMRRAAEILLAHNSSGSLLGWAQEMVVEELSSKDPPLAAALLLQEAEMHLGFGTRDVYVASANRLREARDLLRDDAHVHIWKDRLTDFRRRHAHLTRLIDILDECGLR